MTTIETKEARLNELKAELAEIRAEMKDDSISNAHWGRLQNYRYEIRCEIEKLQAEIDAEIDANIKKVAAQKVDAILTSGVQPVIVTTTFKNNRCSVNIDGAKVSLDKAVTILCESELARRGENVLLINENSDVCPLDEDLFILGKHNVKTAIRQFARGEKVTGAKVLNGKFYPVVKANAEPAAEPAVEETATIETKIAKNRTLICKFNGKRVAWHNALAELEINPVGTVVAGNGHSYTCITNNVPASEGLTYETGYLFEDENGNRYIFDNSAFAIRAIAYNNVDEYAVTVDAQDATVEAEPAAEPAVEETAIVEVKTASEMKTAYAASRNVVRVHFTAKGNPAWQSIYHYGLNDRETGYQRISKKDAAAELAKFGLTTEQVIAVQKAQDAINAEESEAYKTARNDGRCYSRLCYHKVYQKALAMVFGEDEPAIVEDSLTLETLEQQDNAYRASGKAFYALNLALRGVPFGAERKQAKKALDDAFNRFDEKARAFEESATEIYGKLEEQAQRATEERLHKVSTQVKAMFDAVTVADEPAPAPVDDSQDGWVENVVTFKRSIGQVYDDLTGQLNAKAPAGWEVAYEVKVTPDADYGYTYETPHYVTFNGKTVATLERVYIDDVRRADEFWAKFTPPTEPKPGSPYAIARGLDDVFRKTFHKVAAPYLDVTTQDGAKIVTTFGAAFISVDWRAVGGYVFGNHFNDVLARYETPEQVTDVMTALRDAIRAGKTEFTFPTVDEFTAKLAALDAAIEANQPAEVKALNAELDASTLQAPCMWIRIVDGAGNHRSSFSGGSLSAVHIEYNAEPEAIKGYTLRYFGEPMELYDTFAQVTAAVEQFKAAIISNAETFTFPTVEALTPEEPAPVVEETDYEKYLKASEYVITSPGRYLGIDKFGKDKFATKWATLCPYRKINKATARNILATFGLTPETYLAEKAKWVAAEIARGSRQFAIDMQAEFLRDKIDADRKASVEPMPALFPADDSDDDDELIDPPEVKAPADEFTAKLAAFDAEITHAETARAAAKAAYDKADIDAQNAIAARQDFLDKTAGALTEKLHAIPPHRDYIGTATLSGCPVTFMDFDNVYVDATLGGKFKFVTCNNRELARYDTPAQVETVIGKLKDAVARHKPVFHFPTVEELNASPEPPKTESVKARKSSLSPSARRYINAREEAQERRIRREYLWDLEQRFYPN